jgi:hypothetical protein
MEPGESERRKRAAARAGRMTVRKDGQHASEGDAVRLTPEESLSLVHELTLSAWALSGKPLPQYTRATTPIRIIKGKAE